MRALRFAALAALLGAAVLLDPAGVSRGQEQAIIVVDLAGYAFQPATLTISAGTTVEWVNLDEAEHTVTADDGTFDSGLLRRGDRFRQTFATPGTYGYYCRLYGAPGRLMSGTVVVSAPEAEPGPPAYLPTAGPAPSATAAPLPPAGPPGEPASLETPAPTPPPALAPPDAPADPADSAPPLQVGMLAVVQGRGATFPQTFVPSLGVYVRAEPSLEAPVVGRARPGVAALLLAGPIRTDEAHFWLVQNAEGAVGYAAPLPEDLPPAARYAWSVAHRLRIRPSASAPALGLIKAGSLVRVVQVVSPVDGPAWARVSAELPLGPMTGYLPADLLVPIPTR